MANLVVLRRELAATGRMMQERGYVVAAEGNLSVRVGGHCFLVTPAGRRKGDLRVQDLVEVDLQGRTARGRPTSEWPLHREIYLARSDVGAVCHAHCPWATAFAAVGRDLDGSLLTETAALLPRVPLAPRAEPGTEALAATVRPFLAGHHAVLMGNHGVVAYGADLAGAFARLETVERLAQVTLLAEAAAGRSPVDAATLEKLRRG
ncbi:class II aldolase/adducin family protein [bacterium]|nr:class II aldolase/adducin family protein [bacterium]